MPSVKKVRLFPTKPMEEAKALAAIQIQSYATSKEEYYSGTSKISKLHYSYDTSPSRYAMRRFHETFGHPVSETIAQIWRLYPYIFATGKGLSDREIFNKYIEALAFVHKQPVPVMDFFFLENMQIGILEYSTDLCMR
jgi:hypothetical protein